MLFSEEDAPLLKTWIVKRLENTSDADADVLADYVLALLRHDGEVADVRKLCEEEIPDFLKEDSSVFVSDVFDAIRYKSYLPGAPPAPKRQQQPPPAPEPSFEFSGLAFPGPGAAGLPPLPPVPAQNGSRKRTFQDRGDSDAQNGRDPNFLGGRAFKQPRRGGGGHGGRGGRSDNNMNGSRGGRGPGGYPGGPAYPSLPQGMPGFDLTNPLDAIMKMQQMGIPLPPLPDFPPQQGYKGQRMPQQQQQRRRGRCRDYDIKGYCARGQNCMFEHGPSSMYVPPQVPSGNEEYDPTQAAMMMQDFQDQMAAQLPPQSSHFQPNGRNGGPPRDGRRGGRGGGQPKGKGRAAFSAEGPVHDKSKSTIVVENIPEENFTEDEVRSYFSQFGNIVEVSMQPYKRLAIVKYDNWGAANAAYRSPKVMFDNRFVKVFWFKEDHNNKSQSPGASINGAAGGPNSNRSNGGGGGPENEIDMEEFARKQEEAQKQHEEKMQKKQEVEKQRLELEKRQKELMAKQQEEKQKLLAKIAAGSKKEEPGDVAMSDDGAKTASKPSSTTEALRAQLAFLEEEAKMLGLDPNAPDDGSSSWSGRGRGRGRGGSFRARGGFPPRGSFRGGYRGRGGGGPAAYAAFSLDNRPRKVAVTGLDLTTPDRDEALRQHLFSIGEFTDVQSTPSITNITFKDRKTAEKFFYGLSNKEIPGISGPVELAWVNNTSAAAPAADKSSSATPSGMPSSTSAIDFATTTGGGGGTVNENGSAKDRNADVPMGEVGGARTSGGAGAQDQHAAEMDYDVGDENDWGIE